MGIFLGGIIDLLPALITGNTVLFLGPEQQKDKTFFIDKEVNIFFILMKTEGSSVQLIHVLSQSLHTLMLSCTISHGK